MAGQVSAREGALRSGAETVARAQAELQGELDRLEGDVSALGASWTGDGAIAFHRLMDQWRENSNRVVRALTNLENSLNASQTRHEQTEQAAQALFQGVGKLLN